MVQIEPLGESGYLLRSLPREPWKVADQLRAAELPGVQSVIAAYETVAVYFIGSGPTLAQIESSIEPGVEELSFRTHQIPVCYELGEDLEEVCRELKLSKAELISIHCDWTYTCVAIGFTAGFPYLGPVPPQLEGMPRRSSPRLRVPAGSVAITGKQAAMYPTESPGGWALLGRTPLTLVDQATDYYPITAGDRLCFYAIDLDEFEARFSERLP